MPATDILIVAGVALVVTVLVGLLSSGLVSSDGDFIYSPVSMLLVMVTYVGMGGAALWAARRTGDVRRALGLVAPRILAARDRARASAPSSWRSS